MSSELRSGLTQVMGHHLGGEVVISDLRRLSGGTSHETWAFDAACGDGPLTALVLRREFERGMLDTDNATEFALLGVLHGAGIPVARPRVCGDASAGLGLPFMVLDRLDGLDLRKELARWMPGRNDSVLARRCIELQAAIHAVDTAALPALGGSGAPAEEVQRWAGVFDAAKTAPEPLVATAVAWLSSHLPPSGEIALVHGDFKANNLLVVLPGDLSVLDWEMAHLGDPIEDLAWTMLWQTDADVVGGLHSAQGYLAAYTAATGREVAPDRLLFWRILSLVKLSAIFATGMRGEPLRPTLRLMGRASIWLHAQLAAALIEATREKS
ncbi:MAG: phosphotransferase family protein [Sporichthyaceae bacterium]